MSKLNIRNRTLAVMDNLAFLRAINNECIDLIAIDPPYAANKTFSKSPKLAISPEEIAEEKALAEKHGVQYDELSGVTKVKDSWSWDADVPSDWQQIIERKCPAIVAVLRAIEATASENEVAYVAFMALRLIECHRVLKPTGSIYVHCDDHASSYLRMLLDAIFGFERLGNQIVWRRAIAHNDAKRYGRILDHILYYRKGNEFTWNPWDVAEPKTGDKLLQAYPLQDKYGRYASTDLSGTGTTNGKAGEPWGKYTVTDKGCHWAVARTGKYAEYIEQNFIPGYRDIDDIHQRLDALDEAGLIHHPKTSRGIWPGLKRYAVADTGNLPQNLILEPTGFTNFTASGSEYTGYSTQKPVELYERIIKVSSNPNDVVLDVFAGCATTVIAAEKLGRQWIACDVAYRSWTMLKRRFYQNGYALNDMTDNTRQVLGQHQMQLQEAQSYTMGPMELPQRDDADPVLLRKSLDNKLPKC